jgi:hypothetical protein
VHVRSKSLSHAALPTLPNQTNVEIEHHDRPTALFRTSPSEEHAGDIQRVPSPAPEPNSSPISSTIEPAKLQNFVGDFTPNVIVKDEEDRSSSSGKVSRPSTMSSVSNPKRVPSSARQSSASPYSAFHVVPINQATNNKTSPPQAVPYDAISVESL